MSGLSAAAPGSPGEPTAQTALPSATSASHAGDARCDAEATASVKASHAELRAMWRLLRRLGVGASELDDAAQQVFLVAAEREGSFDPEKRQAFLYGVALRVARRLFERGSRHVPGLDEGHVPDLDTPSIEELVDRQKARALLDRVLLEMPLDLRVVFVLYELEDLSTAEIARALELRRGTVASRLRRARQFFTARVARLTRRIRHRGAAP